MITALPYPAKIIPDHRQTWCALVQAQRIADWAGLPNDHAIRLAIRSGNLTTVIDTLTAHRAQLGAMVGMADNFVEKCQLIFKEYLS